MNAMFALHFSNVIMNVMVTLHFYECNIDGHFTLLWM